MVETATEKLAAAISDAFRSSESVQVPVDSFNNTTSSPIVVSSLSQVLATSEKNGCGVKFAPKASLVGSVVSC